MNKPEHVIQGLAIDWEPRVTMLSKGFHHSFKIAVFRDRNNLGPWDHRFFNCRFREFKNLIYQPPLVLIQQAFFLRGVYKLAYFVFGITRTVFTRGFESE